MTKEWYEDDASIEPCRDDEQCRFQARNHSNINRKSVYLVFSSANQREKKRANKIVTIRVNDRNRERGFLGNMKNG